MDNIRIMNTYYCPPSAPMALNCSIW